MVRKTWIRLFPVLVVLALTAAACPSLGGFPAVDRSDPVDSDSPEKVAPGGENDGGRASTSTAAPTTSTTAPAPASSTTTEATPGSSTPTTDPGEPIPLPAPVPTTVAPPLPTTQPPTGGSSLLRCAGASVVPISGSQSSRLRVEGVTSGTVFDAWTAVWLGVHDWPVYISGGSDICLSGGRVEGTYSPSTSWDTLHSTGAVNASGPRFVVEGVRIHNYGDGIRIRDDSNGFAIRDVHLSHLRDDCIENDRVFGGTLSNSLLDGCYVGLSARPSSSDSSSHGAGNTWTVTGSLIRLEPMPTVYKGPAPGHGGFFKWDKTGRGPGLALHNNVFRVDQLPNHTGLGIPPGALTSCSNNVMVWLGPGDYPEPLPSCFTITRDVRVWDNAVAAWHAAH